MKNEFNLKYSKILGLAAAVGANSGMRNEFNLKYSKTPSLKTVLKEVRVTFDGEDVRRALRESMLGTVGVTVADLVNDPLVEMLTAMRAALMLRTEVGLDAMTLPNTVAGELMEKDLSKYLTITFVVVMNREHVIGRMGAWRIIGTDPERVPHVLVNGPDMEE